MEAWKQFELDCTKYLNNTYRKQATFIHQGAENSRVADIKCETQSGKVFYIEAKHCPAQCNQFVLIPKIESRSFEYSRLNAIPINRYSQTIIEEMNKDFDRFKDAGTGGEEIIFEGCEEVFQNWVTEAYKKKNVKYFIVNDYRIFPLDEFSNNFNLSAKYRVKRSGSAPVGSRDSIQEVLEYVKSHFSITGARIDGKKLFVSSNSELHGIRFVISDTEYMLSKRGSEFEVRRLSNTFNANVIFSVSLKYPGTDLRNNFVQKLS